MEEPVTERKPPQLSVPAWVERQIRAAEQSGAFDDLPGKGRPIPDLGRKHDDMAWVADYLRRENVDAAELLPPALALAKEVEQLPERLAREASEARVRRHIETLNARIHSAYARPHLSGPPMRVRPVDLEAAVRQRRTTRPTPPAAEPAPPTPVRARRRWFRRQAT
jgi:DnaJ-like protein